MKFLALIALTLPFAACETIENEDGTRTTRFDAKAADSIVRTGFDTYDRYQRYQQPYQQPAPVAYPVYPQPIYP